MSIAKKHSYDIVKLYLNQIGINVFSFIIMTPLISISESVVLKVGVSVFTTLFFSVLIYTMAWDLGAKDRLSVDAGRLEPYTKKGIVLSLFANIPNFLFAGVAGICLLISALSGSDGVIMTIGGVFCLIAKFTMMIYNGIVESIFAFASQYGDTVHNALVSFGYMLTGIIPIFVTQLGYSFGYKEKKLFGGHADAKKK